jgi:hypothetical protein
MLRADMLSVCCLFGGPPARLISLLRIVRPIATEIVVAVDERVDAASLGPVAALADTLLRYQYEEQPERARQWLHEQATQEWVFWVDGDEVPSRALLDVLGAPPADVTHCYVRRRWLWRDGWIDAEPWWPDWQIRLMRRDSVRLPGILHIPVVADGPHRYLEAPLYHLDLLVKDRATREAQVRRFEAARPGLRIGGRPLNEAYYLPESRDPPVAAIPDEDAPFVEAVLNPPPLPRDDESRAPALALGTRAEIDARWGQRALPEEAYRARLEPLVTSCRLVAGEVGAVDVRVTNLGTETWRHGHHGLPEIRLSYRELPDALRTPLPHDLEPGETTLVPVSIRAPEEVGRRTLTLDVLHEHHRWFDAGAAIELEVAPRLRAVVIVGQPPGDAAFDARVDDVLARLDPELEPLLVGPKPDWLRDRFHVDATDEPPARANAVHVVEAGRRRDRLRQRLTARRIRRDTDRFSVDGVDAPTRAPSSFFERDRRNPK